MPKKTLTQKTRKAKAAGKPVTLQKPETEPTISAKASRAVKKAQGVVRQKAAEAERAVRPRKAPTEGKLRRPPPPGLAERAAPREARLRLPREEAKTKRVEKGTPTRLSPGKKKSGET